MPDAEETGAEQGDADQKGEEGQKGQKESKGDADQATSQTGADGGPDPQAIHDRAFAEARRTFQEALDEKDSTIQDLRGRIEKLENSGEDDDEIQQQIEELKSNFQEQLEQKDAEVARAADAWVEGRLIAALEAAGIRKPEYHAQVLRNRVNASLGEDGFGAEVLTQSGGKALNPKTGEPMSLADLASQFAESNPDFVRDNQQQGSGYRKSGEPQTTSLEDMIREASKKGDLDSLDAASAALIAGRG